MQDTIRGLVDPFFFAAKPPKLSDGRVSRTAAFKLRTTGTITCSSTGATTVVLLPGLSNVICWRTLFTAGDEQIMYPLPFTGHVGSAGERASVKSLRSTGTGLRLSLLNSAEQNEGFWEAARVNFTIADMTADATTGVAGAPAFMQSPPELANYATYMTGKNRDLHRYQFKLNSSSAEHPFTDFISSTLESGATPAHQFVDETWDMIIIKIHGRVDATSPTLLMYDSVSNQEVVYAQNTALARLMTEDVAVSDFDTILAKTNYQKPAVQIS
jgi:hypothetical protein